MKAVGAAADGEGNRDGINRVLGEVLKPVVVLGCCCCCCLHRCMLCVS
jgi:hypothetical protein